MAGNLRKSFAVFSVQLAGEALSLVRSILLARLLGPAEMGVCAILSLALSLLDMLSDLGPDRLMIQAPDGDDPAFQKTAQTLQASRGLICALSLTLLAGPAAAMLGTPEAMFQIMAIGLIMLVRGGLHLDIKRRQRVHDFRPQLTADLLAALASTATVLLLANWLRNSWLFVAAGAVQAMVLVGVSHLRAERQFAWGYDPQIARRMMIFGWPLVLNGLLMFGAMQGDRLIVMSSSTKADLGRYAVAIQFSLLPVLLLSRVASTLWLPLLARDQNHAVRFQLRLDRLGFMLAAVALTFSIGFLTCGGPVLRLLYGSEFSVSPALWAWLAVMQGTRLLRSLPSIAAMARADSINPLAANILRLLGLGAALAACLMGAGLVGIAAAGAAGEVAALAGSIALLKWRHQVSTSRLWEATLLYSSGISLAALWELGAHRTQPVGMVAAGLVLACLGRLILRASRRSLPELSTEVLSTPSTSLTVVPSGSGI